MSEVEVEKYYKIFKVDNNVVTPLSGFLSNKFYEYESLSDAEEGIAEFLENYNTANNIYTIATLYRKK